MSYSITVMSPEGFSCFTVGETAPYKMTTEGAALHISPQGLTVVLSMPSPTALEIDAIRGKVSGRAGVMVTGRLGFLVFDLGNGVKFECPFDAGVEDPNNVPVLENLTPESRLGLLIVASDPYRPTDYRVALRDAFSEGHAVDLEDIPRADGKAGDKAAEHCQRPKRVPALSERA